MMDTLELAKALIARPSVTPQDAGCQEIIAERLGAAGFRAEPLRFGEVDNLWLRRGRGAPLLTFLGHSDVVPPGPEASWHSPPFEPVVRDGKLYGRGAADMKGSLAAMVTAVEAFLARHPDHEGSLAVLVTSDEEGPSVDGTARVVETLQGRGEAIDWCVVGEPSSERELGDTIKNGRRGSLSARLTVHGQQGHVAYPERADNPIHRMAPILAELVATRWDAGNAHFPPTSLQFSNIHAGTGANNVVPGELEALFNLRYSTELSSAQIRTRVEAILARHGLNYALEWELSGEPFLTPSGELVAATVAAVAEVAGREPRLSTAGGTSDGRFIAPTGAQVVELGPVNESIHKVDEHVAVADLPRLARMYTGLMERLLKG